MTEVIKYVKRHTAQANQVFAQNGVEGTAVTAPGWGSCTTFVSMHSESRKSYADWIEIAKEWSRELPLFSEDVPEGLGVSTYSLLAAPPSGNMAVVAIVWEVL